MDEKVRFTEKPGYYAVIPANVRYDKTISANAKLLYGEISCLLNFRGVCFASNEYFCRLYELSESQVSRLISQLVKQEYIEVNVENTATGSKRFITLPLRKNAEGGVRKNAEGGVRKNAYHNKQSINISSLSNDKEHSLFVEFWNLYGYKVGLKTAFKSWIKLTPEIHQIIIKKLPAWLADRNPELSLPHPTTFLNQERWNDEITPKSDKPQQSSAAPVTEVPNYRIDHSGAIPPPR